MRPTSVRSRSRSTLFEAGVIDPAFGVAPVRILPRGEARRDAPDGPDGTVSGVLFSPLAERGATRLHSPPNRQAGPRRTQRDV